MSIIEGRKTIMRRQKMPDVLVSLLKALSAEDAKNVWEYLDEAIFPEDQMISVILESHKDLVTTTKEKKHGGNRQSPSKAAPARNKKSSRKDAATSGKNKLSTSTYKEPASDSSDLLSFAGDCWRKYFEE